MKLLFVPYDSFIIQTKDHVDKIANILRENTKPSKRLLGSWGNDKKFEGIITKEDFRIIQNISYRNSFLPVLHGIFNIKNEGTFIEVKMKLHPYVVIFAILFVIFFFTSLLDFLFSNSSVLDVIVPEGIIMVAFYLMIIIGFSYEANKSRMLLIDLINDGGDNKATHSNA